VPQAGEGGQDHDSRAAEHDDAHTAQERGRDANQAFALVIIDLTNPDTLGYRSSLTDQSLNAKPPGRASPSEPT